MRLLIINLHGLGDNIAMTPTVRALKKKNPELNLFLLVDSKMKAVQEFWSTNPYVDHIIISRIGFHPKFWNPFKFYLSEYWKILNEAKEVSSQHGIEKTILIRNQYLPEFIDQKVSFWPLHRADRIAFESGVNLSDYTYDVFWNESHEAKALSFLEKNNLGVASPLVALHTMPTWDPRRWRLGEVQELVTRLNISTGAQFIHIHTKNSFRHERELDSEILDRTLVTSTAYEGLDILSIAALLSKCELVIAVDSGIAYLANACGIPLILLCIPKFPLKARLPKQGLNSGIEGKTFSAARIIPQANKLLSGVGEA